MYRFLLTPRWWGIHAFLVLSIPFCLFMGSWQLSRFEDRMHSEDRAKEQAAERTTERPRPLASLLPVDTDSSGKRAEVTGRYGKQLLVPDRRLGSRDGFYVLNMLRPAHGPAVPVVRGWLPGEPDPARVPKAPQGRVTVVGALQPSETSSTDGVSSRGGLPTGQLGMISAASLVNVVPYQVEDAWITLPRAEAPLTPVPARAPEGTGLDLKAFQNLGYTGEWFIFAGFVLFMWFRLFRREVEFARDEALGLHPTDRDRAPAAAADPEAQKQTQAQTAQKASDVQEAPKAQDPEAARTPSG